MKINNKQKIINDFRTHNIEDYEKQIRDGKIIYNIILGDKMTKVSKIDLILQEMRQGFNQVNTRLDRVEGRLDNLEKDVSILKQDVALIKQCPTIKQELIGN